MVRKNPLTARAAVLAAALAAGLTFGAPAAAQSWAPGDLSLAAANGSRKQVRKVELNLGWTREQPLWQGQDWRLRLRHEVVLGQWHVPQARNIAELGYSPVLRLERLGASGSLFFFEGSIGARLLSHTWIAPNKTLSTAFQFADMLGVGMQWGQGAGEQTVGLRYQHQSNADIKKPNPGINFMMLYYRYAF
ncbi:MAG: acyloxyacyl hydrolase [Burkholderiaceae bacterium]|jgi:hypothetical protein|nr:acyloxyacyl hydrolase [Burkholderiaceae bacterium]